MFGKECVGACRDILGGIEVDMLLASHGLVGGPHICYCILSVIGKPAQGPRLEQNQKD
jgi:hypothetical protein